MTISEHLKEYAERRFEDRQKVLEPVWERIQEGLSKCTPEEQILMKFLYGTMPVRDAGEYDFKIFYGYVSHSLWLRENIDWCASLPEDVFVHYVLYYRINSEDICDCRSFFYEKLKDRVAGLNAKEAVLEINYWCAENATYEAADNRTISPLTVYRSGRGRCGEESTFTVSVLRSVGIGARQVYTPRWAHCDDNHAWVEVYLDGKWHFLGACEPEEVLDKGWFSNASSRALLVHSRTFSDYVGETAEECIGREDLLIYYNNTATYAKTKQLEIVVKKQDNSPACAAEVSIEILNMAEYCSVTTLYADENGIVRITTGLGDIHVRAVLEDCFEEALVRVGDCERTELKLVHSVKETQWVEDKWINRDLEAPQDYPMHPVTLTAQQKQRRRERLALANRLREERITGYYREDLAAAYPKEQEILHLAGGNFDEVYAFLSKDDNPDRRAMLHSLSVKDYKDLKAQVLETHLDSVRGEWPEKLYVENILCPRIYFEELTPYRFFIRGYFTKEEQTAFCKDPEQIWSYIRENISYIPEVDYKTICATPVGCLKMKQGNILSQKILFVAICRTLGIPARLNKVTVEPEYYMEGSFRIPGSAEGFGRNEEMADCALGKCEKDNLTADRKAGAVAAGKQDKAVLTLSVEDAGKWIYYQTWTIGVLDGKNYRTLDYEGIRFEGNMLTLKLDQGVYRLITTSRMPNGNQHASERVFLLENGENKEINMTLREGSAKDLLVHNELVDFDLTGQDGQVRALSSITAKEAAVLAFLEEGAEPTEHVLNELLASAQDWNRLDIKLIFVVRDASALENATLAKTLEKLDKAMVFYDPEGENTEPVARRMYVDPEKLPLLVAIRDKMTGIYGCSGYNVGSVELMRKLLCMAQ